MLTPEFLTGFPGPSTTGKPYPVEYINLVIRIAELWTCTECRSGSSLASSSLRWTVCMEAHFPAPQG